MIGLLSAMREECEAILAAMKVEKVRTLARRDFVIGTLEDVPVVAVFSRWGKVAAATTTAILLSELQVTEVLFTGVAGAISPALRQSDVVIGTDLVFHDLDARPFCAQREIPLLGVDRLTADPAMQATLLRSIEKQSHSRLGDVHLGKVHLGKIATGDQFIASPEKAEALRREIPDVLCVEMEGCAVAQVCFEYGVPFAIARIVSDDASHAAPLDFLQFVLEKAAPGGLQLVSGFLRESQESKR